ncbi:hypothetical protein HID58_043517, partial [Brassica napus]
SIDADRLLKLEGRIEFPNGDFGKVYMTYEGLNRHCFGSIVSLLPGTDWTGLPGQSRGEKRHTESESYWTAKANSGRDAPPKLIERRRIEGYERYPHHQGKTTVWNRLDDWPDGNQWITILGQGRLRWNARNAREDAICIDQGSDITLISHKLPNKLGDHGLREMRTRNKPYEEGYKCVMVRMDKAPYAIITRDRGTVVIREGGIRSPPHAPRYVPPPLRLRDETEEPSLDLVNLMNSKHIDDMVLTREEEAEVDKLADEFGDVDMDEDMVQNDDLLIDEPGYDAEIIDAISQLSPENAVKKENGATTGAEKEQQPTTMDQMKNKSAGSSKILHASSGQSRAGGTGEEKRKATKARN